MGLEKMDKDRAGDKKNSSNHSQVQDHQNNNKTLDFYNPR